MAHITTQIIKYLEANGKTEAELHPLMNVMVQDDSDGKGPKIVKWDVSGLVQPTTSQLNALDSAADTEETNRGVKATRKKSYGDIGDQLDEIYKDIDAWKTRIKKIKDDNPKS